MTFAKDAITLPKPPTFTPRIRALASMVQFANNIAQGTFDIIWLSPKPVRYTFTLEFRHSFITL